jgi:putative membrane protein
MLITGIEPTLNTDAWRYQMHPEIWVLVVGLIAAFVYAIRVVGPKVVPSGEVISRNQIRIFSLMIFLLWISTDWPLHDIAEEYLYSMHMLQHTILAYIVPPLALLATPEWLFRLLVGEGRAYRVIRFLTRPVIAAVIYNTVVVVTHIPGLVNRSAAGGPLHYGLHVILVTSALMLWTPICGPAKEWRMSYGAMMAYLFCTSLVPSIPAGWLTFATGPVYKHYDTPVRVWGLSILSDQQLAGGIMKLGGSTYLWGIIITIFFTRFMKGFFGNQSYSAKESSDSSQ